VLAYDDESGIWVRENGVSRLLHAGTEPQWSPDGRRLAFLLHNGLHGGLVGVIAADGSGYRSLGWGWSPSWSPDGTAIVYATDEGLVAVRADGVGRARRLTRTTGVIRDSSPSWSATAIR
jgi:Tol biopolymer transport system component